MFISKKVFDDMEMTQPLRALGSAIARREMKVKEKWVKYKDEDGIMLEK